MSKYTIALAGNPNCGKTTLFNALTGARQYVGNWPGVTVEQKSGNYRKDKEVAIMDLPGIYSLSPYSAEEVVARTYLAEERPDAIINIVDATNLERNLYLTTQLLELGIPTIVALNMMDLVRKNGIELKASQLEKELGCKVVEISALKNENIDEAVQAALAAAKKGALPNTIQFEAAIEAPIAQIAEKIADVPEAQKRFTAIKLFEGDAKIGHGNAEITAIAEAAAKSFDDDTESVITEARYSYITSIIGKVRTKKGAAETLSDKIDSIVTNRVLGLPIFALVMFLIYYVSVQTVGAWVTDWTNDVFVGEWISDPLDAWLSAVGCNEILQGLIIDGIIGGIGGMLGFMPQMLIVFIFLALLEDCGYMSRVAFVMDRVFRHFGMSGKSFIPLLVGTGCGLPGIMATRTIENEKDRRLTMMTVTFMPCGAKLPLISAIVGAFFGHSALIAFSCYVLGIASVIITGVMLKKTKMFAGEVTPFVMELPAYHLPTIANVWHSIAERLIGFAKKFVTIYILACLLIWFLSSFGWADGAFGLIEDTEESVAAALGNTIAWLFTPCGFANWQCVMASVLGLAAKEEIVGVLGELVSIADALDIVEEDPSMLTAIASLMGGNGVAGYAFLVFNLLCCPCLAAINTLRGEMQNTKLFAFAVAYQIIFAYVIATIVYQFGMLIVFGTITPFIALAIAFLAIIVYFCVRKGYQDEEVA